MDWKTNQDEEFNKNYKELKSLLDGTLKKVSKLKDLREAKGLLITVQNTFKGLRLSREDREELYGRLQEAFAEVNKKVAEERSNYEHEALSNYGDFKIRVDEAVFLTNHPKDFHETWDFLIEVQSSFKGAKLLREHREELYTRLQIAFDTLKKKQASEKSIEFAESSLIFNNLLHLFDETITQVSGTNDTTTFREELVRLQRTVKESNLSREHRETLNGKLQEAFLTIQIRQEEEYLNTKTEATENFRRFQPIISELLKTSEESEFFHETREKLKALQSEIRNSKLLKEQREDLNGQLQQAFEKVGAKQSEKQELFTRESKVNYEQMKALVEKGFTQAEESSKYKETREFLKKIQADFKGVKLSREDREVLYSRLQTAFTILNRRVDEFFREKKKNWMIKMQYKFSESSSEIFMLQQSLQKDESYLSELEDQLEIVIMAGKDSEVISGLQSRINSTKKSIKRKYEEIQVLEKKMDELQSIIDPQDIQE
jgi:hypothetical protein